MLTILTAGYAAACVCVGGGDGRVDGNTLPRTTFTVVAIIIIVIVVIITGAIITGGRGDCDGLSGCDGRADSARRVAGRHGGRTDGYGYFGCIHARKITIVVVVVATCFACHL